MKIKLIRPLCHQAYGLFYSCTVMISLLLSTRQAAAQDTTSNRPTWQNHYITTVSEKMTRFDKSLDSYTDKTLNRLIRREKKMQRQVAAKDTTLAKKLFNYSIDSLQHFKSLLSAADPAPASTINPGINPASASAPASTISAASLITPPSAPAINLKANPGPYFAYLDTLRSSLNFLKTTNATGQLNALESRLAIVNKLNEYLAQRQSVLQGQLNAFPQLSSGIKNLQKEAGYYQAQVNAYKETLKDPEKIEKLALNTLESSPAFQQFIAQHGQLAGIFAPASAFSASPGGNLGALFSGSGLPGLSTGSANINGLSPRAAVQQSIQATLPSSAGGSTQFFQQQTDAAQSAWDQLKNKTKSGNGQTTPDSSLNPERTKSFGKRLEYGANLQFGKSTNYLPATTQINLTAGYKFNAHSSFGFGLTYLLGMGEGWNKIRFSNQALGLSTYLKWKWKNNFFLQGSGEWNYMTAFQDLQQLHNIDAWQTSALLGLGKSYRISKKLSGNIQLAYDLLYKQHIPNTQPLVFRVGYNFN